MLHAEGAASQPRPLEAGRTESLWCRQCVPGHLISRLYNPSYKLPATSRLSIVIDPNEVSAVAVFAISQRLWRRFEVSRKEAALRTD